MDAELMGLASTAGTAVVTVLTTDLWERARSAVGGLWQRAYPDRAETVEAELLETRELLLSSAADEDESEARQDEGGSAGSAGSVLADGMADEWRGKFRRLLIAHPELARDVRRIVDEELAPALPERSQPASVVFNASPTGHARVYQAGRDQHITGR